MKIFDSVLNEPWALPNEAFGSIIDIVDRNLKSEIDIDEVKARFASRIAAVEGIGGKRLDGTAGVSMRDGVAIVPIIGPIFRRANLFTAISGATSIEILAKDFTTAINHPSIKGVLLTIDSPGGTVSGVNELSQLILAAANKREKPIISYVDGICASGAYWLASAAHRIVVDETSRVGSIGVVMAGVDTRERDAKRGVRNIKIISSQSPGKQPDPATEDGHARLQARVDKLAAVFIGTVARNRGVEVDTVKTEFGRGDMLIGAEAVDVGMADAIGTHEGILAGFAAGTFKAIARRDAESQTKESTMKTNHTSNPKADQSDPEKLIGNAALPNQDRLAELEAISLPGFEDLLAAAKADGVSTKRDLALKIIRRQQDRLGVAAAYGGGDTDEASIKFVWGRDASLRADFGGNFEAFKRYRSDVAAGRVRGMSSAFSSACAATNENSEIDDSSVRSAWDADAGLRADFAESFEAYKRYRSDRAGGRFHA